MITSLAYIGFRSPHAEDWRTFGPDVLGAELAPDGPDGAVRLRVDDVAHRIAIHPGERDDLAYLGWLVDDLDATVAASRPPGRRCRRRARSFVDPFGFRHELVTTLEAGPPFTPGRPMPGFVTGEPGARPRRAARARPRRRRAVLHRRARARADPTPSRAAASTSASSTARPRRPPPHGGVRRRCPGMAGLHHLMLEVTSLDDVGTALDVVERAGDPAGDEPRAPHQRPDDVVLRAHAVGLRDRVRHRRASSSTTTRGRSAATTQPEPVGPPARRPTARCARASSRPVAAQPA